MQHANVASGLQASMYCSASCDSKLSCDRLCGPGKVSLAQSRKETGREFHHASYTGKQPSL